jgi:hypothetical protein
VNPSDAFNAVVPATSATMAMIKYTTFTGEWLR